MVRDVRSHVPLQWAAWVALALFFAPASLAHEVWPAYLQLRQTSAENYDVLFKLPAAGALRLPLYARLPDRCNPTSPTRVTADARAHVERWSVHCSGGLDDATVGVEGLAVVPTDALLRIERQDGSSHVVRLTPDAPFLTLETRAAGSEVATTYFALGVEHILLGIDHLLFVLALFIVTRGPWALVKAVTAFTVAHSITLGAATLGFVRAPSAPIEALIALSIVFVAAEIVRLHRGGGGLTARTPWVVAFGFGLLHGFGFAGALSEVGLPQHAIPLALLLFNVGVEVGQLIFLAALGGLLMLIQRSFVVLPRWAQLVPAYGIGSVAMMWVIERVAAL